MKHLFCISAIFLCSLASVHAQRPITLADDSVRFGNRYYPGSWLSIPEVKPEAVKSSWIKTIQKGTKSKAKIETNEITIFGAIIPDVYKGSVNIMSKINDNDSLTRLFVCVETTRDNFIVRNSGEFDKLSKYLKEFGKDQYVALAKDQLSAQETRLRDMEKDLKSARKSNEKFEKNIRTAENRISEEKDKIKNLKKELEVTNADIDKTNSLLITLDEGDVKKANKASLKDLQKKKQGFLKDIDSAETSISRAENSIDDNKKNIELKESSQKELGENINKQKLVVEKFQNKLKAIEAY